MNGVYVCGEVCSTPLYVSHLCRALLCKLFACNIPKRQAAPQTDACDILLRPGSKFNHFAHRFAKQNREPNSKYPKSNHFAHRFAKQNREPNSKYPKFFGKSEGGLEGEGNTLLQQSVSLSLQRQPPHTHHKITSASSFCAVRCGGFFRWWFWAFVR